MGDLLAALASYSQRHFQRMDRLARSAFLLDYTLGAMRVYIGEDTAEGAKDGGDGQEATRDSVLDGDAGVQQGQEGQQQQQQHRHPRMANGHARPHEQTNGNSHLGSASSSDAEFGGHDNEVLDSVAQRADSPEPVHLGPSVAVSGHKHRAEVDAEPENAKRKRRKAEAGNAGSDAGVAGDDDNEDGDDDEAEPAVGAEGIDEAEHAKDATNAARKAAANRKKKQKKKRRKAKATAVAASCGGGEEDGSAKPTTTADGKARKARRTTRTPG